MENKVWSINLVRSCKKMWFRVWLKVWLRAWERVLGLKVIFQNYTIWTDLSISKNLVIETKKGPKGP